ncbi:LysR family transcriptional regulator [Endothiovibrio diazotrophicus]
MDTDLLKTFLEVNRTRHFGRAAENLFLTPSAVSARVRLLEEQLAVALFIRERNNLRLTPSGERLLGHARQLLATWERARQDVALGEGQLDPLTVAAIPGLWDSLLGHWLAALRRAVPRLALRAESLGTDALLLALRRGRIDLGLLFEPPLVPGLALREVATLELILVADRPLERTAEALAHDYVLIDWGVAFNERHAALFPDCPAAAARLSTARLALGLLEQGGGAAYLARPMVEEALAAGRLFAVTDAPAITLPVFAVHPGDGDKQHHIDAALALVHGTPRT